MKIYFRQTNSADELSTYSKFGIQNCCFKYLRADHDTNKVTYKSHHHNSFEIHIIKNGHQEYELGGKIYSVCGGTFLFIPPYKKHRVVSISQGTEKYSITFVSSEFPGFTECVVGNIPQCFFDNACFINEECQRASTFSRHLIQSRVFECIVLFLRMCGLRETPDDNTDSLTEQRLESIKEYIADNIESWITVSDIASYCHLSQRQLTRLFQQHEGMTPSRYIARQRAVYIEKLLETDELSIKEICEKMNFQNENYFNTFVKKHIGMPPGTFRRMAR